MALNGVLSWSGANVNISHPEPAMLTRAPQGRSVICPQRNRQYTTRTKPMNTKLILTLVGALAAPKSAQSRSVAGGEDNFRASRRRI
jgi:hypothetical protein